MRLEKHKYYMSGPLTFCNIVVLILDSFLEDSNLLSVSMVSKPLNKVVPEVNILLLVDWKSLLKPRLN